MKVLYAVLAAALLQSAVYAYPCSSQSPLGSLSFLAGQWKAEPQSNAGPQPTVLGGGNFTAQFDLHAWALTMKSASRPDSAEDMMFVYSGCGSERANGAVYVNGFSHTVQHCTFEILFPPNRGRPNGLNFSCPSVNGSSPLSFTYRELRPGTIRIDLAGPSKICTSIAHRKTVHPATH